jgi:hypothetical protein
MERTHFYVLLDRTLRLGDLVCQAIHASTEGGKRFLIAEHCNLVLLGVKDHSELLAMSAKLQGEGVEHFVNYEPDLHDQPTAICTEAVTTEQRKLFLHLKTWRAPALV